MTFELSDWHIRFRQQAGWTAAIRTRWFNQIQLGGTARILEVGCGTGALLEQIHTSQSQLLIGIDILRDRLDFTSTIIPQVALLQSDAHHLPFVGSLFDLALCQYLFLWIKNPVQAAFEMKRVIRPGGYVMALAEPDYGARIDYPGELALLGRKQANALRHQGADVEAGRKMASVFRESGMEIIESVILGAQWSASPNDDAWQNEWNMLGEDIADEMGPREWRRLQTIDRRARMAGTRVMFVPTFCVLARRPIE